MSLLFKSILTVLLLQLAVSDPSPECKKALEYFPDAVLDPISQKTNCTEVEQTVKCDIDYKKITQYKIFEQLCTSKAYNGTITTRDFYLDCHTDVKDSSKLDSEYKNYPICYPKGVCKESDFDKSYTKSFIIKDELKLLKDIKCDVKMSSSTTAGMSTLVLASVALIGSVVSLI